MVEWWSRRLDLRVSVPHANRVNPNLLFPWRRLDCERQTDSARHEPDAIAAVTEEDALPLDRGGGVSLGSALWNARGIGM
jgi:hypothetical protein